MGEAKEMVGSPVPKPAMPSIGCKSRTSQSSIIDRLDEIQDDLDKAIEIKQHDLLTEGKGSRAENHFKLGILKAADSMVRRAKAALEDYGSDLQYDIDPTLDEKAASGEDLEEDDPEDEDEDFEDEDEENEDLEDEDEDEEEGAN